MPDSPSSQSTLSVEPEWSALRAAAALARGPERVEPASFAIETSGRLRAVARPDPLTALTWCPQEGWALGPAATAPLRRLADLYLPLCAAGPDRPLVVAHLGQSLDGFIATASGDSYYVTGRENIVHLHRMRALSDAVLVGAGTVEADDPQLTTRLVEGGHPLRVILDPTARLSPSRRVFSDGASPTLRVCSSDTDGYPNGRYGQTEILALPTVNGRLNLAELIGALRQRGANAVLVEGGGRTVSAMLESGLLDRLQVAVAPVLVGQGVPGVRAVAGTTMGDCLRPRCRLHAMGEDVLFDCDLRSPR